MAGRVMPERIQRRRTKGWRMPEGAVYVGRPTRWGNPYPVWETGGPELAVAYYRAWLGTDGAGLAVRAGWELRGRDLACWCPLDQPCHADVLLELANR
jgi:hypothetical protein